MHKAEKDWKSSKENNTLRLQIQETKAKGAAGNGTAKRLLPYLGFMGPCGERKTQELCMKREIRKRA